LVGLFPFFTQKKSNHWITVNEKPQIMVYEKASNKFCLAFAHFELKKISTRQRTWQTKYPIL